MTKLKPRRPVAILFAFVALAGQAAGQDQEDVVVERGQDSDLPYTAIYHKVFRQVEDGSPATVLTLQHPDAPVQCDVFAVPGGETDWSAEAAFGKLDVPGIESTWIPDFPGFKVIAKSVAQFASGPALLYEGESEGSPLGVPLQVIHAETVAGGVTYAIECLMGRSVAGDVRPLVNFIIANFSTRSDGECCIPIDDRG